MVTNIILGLALMLLGGLLISKLCKKLHIPSVTGYLVVGVLLSPGLFGLIPGFPGILNESLVIGTTDSAGNAVASQMAFISELELGFIAFSIGVEFKKDYVKQLGPKPILLAFFESGFAMIAIFGVCMAFYPVVQIIQPQFGLIPYICLSLALGAIGSATAPAATMMVIKQYKAKGPVTNTLVAVVAVDDASALIFFGIAIAIIQIVSSVTTTDPSAQLNAGQLTLICFLPILEIIMSVALGGLLGYLLSLAVKWFKGRGTRLGCTIAAIGLGVGLSLLINDVTNEYASWVNMNVSTLFTVMALGVFFTNLSPEEEQVNDLVERFNAPFTVIFFVLSGASVDFRLFKNSEGGTSLLYITLILIACYVIARSLGKYVGTWCGGKLVKTEKEVTNLLSLGLMPQGGVALGLAIMVGKLGLFSQPLYENGLSMSTIIKLTIVVSCFITELFGPSFTKFMLFKANEADPALR